MFRTLLALIFSAAAFSQGGVGCSPSGATGGIACSPAPSPTCCDYTLLSCQIAVRNCGSTANCAAMICPTMSVMPSRPVRPSQQLTNPTKSAIPSRSAYPVRSANPSLGPVRSPSSSSSSSRSSFPSATAKQNYPSFTATSTSTATLPPRQADPSATSTVTNKQVDPSASRQVESSASATVTNKQVDPSSSSSATMTNKQVDPSATATVTNKQADPSTSATATVKQVDPSTSSTATMTNKQMDTTVTPKPAQSPRPSIYPRQTFNLMFRNANNTLIRSSPKLMQLQTALACVVQTPLENIEITTISVGSTNFPFTKPQGTGMPNCSNSNRSGRRLQATVDTTVSFDLLNSPYVSQATFQTDPTVQSFGSPVSSGASEPAYSSRSNTGAIYGGVIGGLCVIGIASYYGVVYFRSRRSPVRRAGSKPKIQETINPFAPNNRISYSPAVVKISRSNSV